MSSLRGKHRGERGRGEADTPSWRWLLPPLTPQRPECRLSLAQSSDPEGRPLSSRIQPVRRDFLLFRDKNRPPRGRQPVDTPRRAPLTRRAASAACAGEPPSPPPLLPAPDAQTAYGCPCLPEGGPHTGSAFGRAEQLSQPGRPQAGKTRA